MLVVTTSRSEVASVAQWHEQRATPFNLGRSTVSLRKAWSLPLPDLGDLGRPYHLLIRISTRKSDRERFAQLPGSVAFPQI
jgi:hypothetical protein